MPENDGRLTLKGGLDGVLSLIGGTVLFAMMALTFVDVLLRYIFNAPLRGAFEITELLMVVLIYAGLPLVSRHDEHVTTDLLDRFATPGVRRVQHVIVHLICAVALFGITWIIWLKAGKISAYGDTTAALQIRLAPFVYVMCALIVATAVIHLSKAFGPVPEDRAETGTI
jgi:TRAP-type C4-dicarboxylate transport system permease small subunit